MGRLGGIINKLVMGTEKSEDYARSTLPSNRWGLFKDVFFGSFWRLVLINLLTILFFLPLFAVLILRYFTVVGYGLSAPFSGCFGVGVQSVGTYVGIAENIAIEIDAFYFLFLPIALFIGGIGLSGASYVIRNMVWTEGIFVVNDFWKGIKQNILHVSIISVLFAVLFYLVNLAQDWANLWIANGVGVEWLLIVSKIVGWLILGFLSIVFMHMITMTATYKLKFFRLFKNSVLVTLALFPQNLFFAFLALLVFFLPMLGSLLSVLGFMIIAFIGISLSLLVWTDYSQWVYDKFINDRVPGAKKNRGIYEKVKPGESAAMKEYKERIAAFGQSTLSSRPIKPITDEELKLAELPESFSRKDIERLNESRRMLLEDNEKYIEEHINDEKYLSAREEEESIKAENAKKQKRIDDAKRELERRRRKK